MRIGGRGGELRLPDPPGGNDLHRCIHVALRVRQLGKSPYFYILIAAAFRAAMGGTDYSVLLHGKSGTQKTECAAIVQSFFGAGFNARCLPESWNSTANALEMVAFTFKDAILVIDDFVADGSRQEVQRQMQVFQRLLRAQGNRAGRGRLTADANIKEGRPPRGMILSTCEDLPTRSSALARSLVLECGPVDLAVLTECQAELGLGTYSKAMSAFLAWVATDYLAINEGLAVRSTELREEFQRSDAHKRTASIIGSLQAGFELFLEFAQAVGAINSEEADLHRQACLDALRQAGTDQVDHQSETDPVNLFLRFLGSAIASGEAHLVSTDGSAPANAEAFGWQSTTSNADGGITGQLRAQGLMVGWIEGEEIFLLPDPALKASHAMGSDLERLSTTRNTLAKRLDERGLLLSKEEGRGRHFARKQIAGKRYPVLHMGVGVLQGAAHAAQPAHTAADGPENADFSRTSWAASDRTPAKSGPLSGPPSLLAIGSSDVSGPNGPLGPQLQKDPPMEAGVGVEKDLLHLSTERDGGDATEPEQSPEEWGIA